MTSSSKANKSTRTIIIQQRSLSIYTLLGAIQSATWFFLLPSITKKYLWAQIFGSHYYSNNKKTNNQHVAEVILWSIGAPYYLLYILVAAIPPYYYFSNWDFIQQFKISKDPWPWLELVLSDEGKQEKERRSKKQLFWRQTYKSIVLDFVGLFVFIPTLVYIKTILLPDYVMSFSVQDFPSPSIQSAITLLSMGLIHEFGFYWTHRFMHTFPSLYKFHKIHHEYKQNNVLSAQHFHPIDFLISIACPAIVTTLIVQPRHAFTQFQFGLWLLTANFDDHLGYSFPWTCVRWFPFSAGTDAHEFHHSVNMGCYGSKLSIWDWLFGTDKVYEEWRRKRWGLD